MPFNISYLHVIYCKSRQVVGIPVFLVLVWSLTKTTNYKDVMGRILKVVLQDSCPLVLQSTTNLGTSVKGLCRLN